MLCRSGWGRHAAWAGVTRRTDPRRFGPCHALRSNAWSSRSSRRSMDGWVSGMGGSMAAGRPAVNRFPADSRAVARPAAGGYDAADTGAPMSDVTRLLNAIEAGDPAAAGRLLPLVYA